MFHGVYDGSDEQGRLEIERVTREHKHGEVGEICDAIFERTLRQGAYLRQIGEEDRVDDNAAFAIEHT